MRSNLSTRLRIARPWVFTALALAASQTARGDGPTIEFFDGVFVPSSVEVGFGDAVTFLWRAGDHTVMSGRPDGEKGTPDEPGALFSARLNESSPEFQLLIDDPELEGFTFFNTSTGQVGFVDIDTGELTFRVGVVDNVFIPEESFVFAGDTVHFEHEFMEAFHTVTSGRSSRPEHKPGCLFDEESSDDRPNFFYDFEEPGEYPYFCRPHEFLDMVGVIWVQEKFVRGDATGEQSVDISDAISILNALFGGGPSRACRDASDANDDGKVDIADPVFILGFLFSGTAEIPPPFPLLGADRTEDELGCWPEVIVDQTLEKGC